MNGVKGALIWDGEKAYWFTVSCSGPESLESLRSLCPDFLKSIFDDSTKKILEVLDENNNVDESWKEWSSEFGSFAEAINKKFTVVATWTDGFKAEVRQPEWWNDLQKKWAEF